MAYWWVNHKQTYSQEVSGGYLWSPKRKANGAQSHFYDNMTNTRPGDIVFSYAGGEVRAIGVATACASSAGKPTEFGQTGAHWGNDGWFVPVEFRLLDRPLRPKEHIQTLAPLLPGRYSPLQNTGNGNQAAYLSSISVELAKRLLDLLNAGALASQLKGVGVGCAMEEADDRVEAQLAQSTDTPETEKEQLVKARRGQGVFRSRVESVERGCRITGLRLKEHLRASHIKPWRVSTNLERLDGNNGLLLAPHIDYLFDRGFLSFDDKGRILISNLLDRSVLAAWGIDQNANVGRFAAEQLVYLAYHQDCVFQCDQGTAAVLQPLVISAAGSVVRRGRVRFGG